MRDENIRLNVKEGMERTKEAYKFANILFGNGLIRD